jgi:RimJ/RimL family protein N-acetyltransferase
MNYIIRHSEIADIPDIISIYQNARKIMKNHSNPQWGDGYPDDALVRQDCDDFGYVVCDEEQKIVACFVFEDNTDYYDNLDGKWLNDEPFMVIKRPALAAANRGLAQYILDWCFEQCRNIKADTAVENTMIQKILEHNGFLRCGTITCPWGVQIAYQKCLG